MIQPFGTAFANTSCRGAASELIACANLLSLGYVVFRAVSPAAPFDLVAYEGDRVIRVEIKSVSCNGPSCTFSRPSNDIWDMLVVVGPDARCFIFEKDLTYFEQIDLIRDAYGYPPANTAVRLGRTKVLAAAAAQFSAAIAAIEGEV